MSRKPSIPMSDMLVIPEEPALRDEDIPAADTAPPEPAPEKKARKVKEKPPKPAPKDYAQRPLYASEETLELIRRIAFEERTTAQALYREGLYLMLRKRGHFKDKSQDDV